MQIRPDQQSLDELCQKWEIGELSVFGSALTEAFGDQSDVDVLVAFLPAAEHSLLDIVRLKEELADILGRNVDLVEDRSLRNPYRRDAILKSREIVYAR